MAARVVQTEGIRYNPNNWLLMHAMGANTGGQVGSVMAAAIMLSALAGMGIIWQKLFPLERNSTFVFPLTRNLNKEY